MFWPCNCQLSSLPGRLGGERRWRRHCELLCLSADCMWGGHLRFLALRSNRRVQTSKFISSRAQNKNELSSTHTETGRISPNVCEPLGQVELPNVSSKLGVTFSISNAFSCKLNPLRAESAHTHTRKPISKWTSSVLHGVCPKGSRSGGANCAAELIAGLCWADKV